MLEIINVPSIHNGVSQQAPQVRSPDQSEAQENAWASLADGLVKRPPTERAAQLSDEPLTDGFVHSINRDTTERYTVIVADGVIRVFDDEGAEIPVSAPAGWGYLEGVTDYRRDIAATSVADYTFIVNRQKTVRLLEPDDPPPPAPETYIPPRSPGGTGSPWDRPTEVTP